jgi:phospholipase/carboxylesterase
MLTLSKTIQPHTGEIIFTAGRQFEEADSAMIMLHGRGATAQSILQLSGEFKNDKMTFIAPQADGMVWYPYRFIEEREVNEPGISSGLKLIEELIKKVNERGIPVEKIFLLGFSQGACLALDYAARNPQKYGGIFGLSGGLIGARIEKSDYSGDLRRTKLFLGCSEDDFHIPEERVDQTAKIFKHLNADVTEKIYPDLGHTVNQDEINFVNKVISPD